jgi:hypothetical protein
LRSQRHPSGTAYHVTSTKTDQFKPVHLDNTVTNPITGEVQEYQHLMKGIKKDIWTRVFANELGRLAQGVGNRMKTGRKTIFFIPKHAVPSNRKVTYGHIVATIRPQKAETHHVHLTVGGDHLDYPGNTSTPTASQTTAKVLINSTISTDDARFGCIDLNDFYLRTPMKCYEYMHLHIDIIPQEIADQYKLKDITTPDGWVYIKIRRGMYGLKQAGIIAYQQLKTHLATYNY